VGVYLVVDEAITPSHNQKKTNMKNSNPRWAGVEPIILCKALDIAQRAYQQAVYMGLPNPDAYADLQHDKYLNDYLEAREESFAQEEKRTHR